jgi:hypothetical protein
MPLPLKRLRRHPVYPPLLALAGFAALTLVCLTAVGGWAAGGVGLVALLLTAALVARYVIGAATFDGGYQRELRLVQEREPSLHSWVSSIEIGRGNALGFERTLRPQFERLYAVRLAENHGVSLYREPARAAELIGPDLWPWVDPSRPEFGGYPKPRQVLDRRAQAAFDPPPVPDTVIIALIDRLEAL